MRATRVRVELFEGVPDKKSWDFALPAAAERYTETGFGFVQVPRKFNNKGIVVDRSNPLLIRAAAAVELPAGEYRFLLRARGAARLWVNDRVLVETQFLKANSSGHESVPELPATSEEGVRLLPVGHQEKLATLELDAGKHEVRLEAFIGGPKLRLEVGELCVAIARKGGAFHLLSPSQVIPFTDEGWAAYERAARAGLKQLDDATRMAAGAEEARHWRRRHELARKEWKDKPGPPVPEVSGIMPLHNAIDRFIGRRLEEAKVQPVPLTDDWAFLRRVTLDTVGLIPTHEEIDAFIHDGSPDRRKRVIDRLLADPRWADHWVAYWQDVLAENPGILKPTLNNTGPFRWWLHEAFLDNLPMDRFATELAMMEGSALGGGPAGFAVATQNDAPMAAKAHILAKAFLGVEMQCARCHDAPFHPFKQQDLFGLAAMLGKGPQKVPATSSVPVAERARRPLIEVTLEPGSKVEPGWPFADLAPAELPPSVLREENNPRERLAAILTSPRNERFAQVMVNRLWKRYLGVGLVEPVDDWNAVEPSHPELLSYLARELIVHDYDLKHVARLILTSHTYQRAVRQESSKKADPAERLFAVPARRRLTAEQLVDSLFLAAGKEFHCEPLTMDPEGRRPITEMINLGVPRRAWEFTSLSNERDRPALALPVAQSVVDVLTTFGWRDSRQDPITVREETPTPLQPLTLANGIVGSRITRLSDDGAFTELCLEEREAPDLVRAVYLRILSRPPTADELKTFTDLLSEGYARRRLAGVRALPKRPPVHRSAVSWANHLSPEATKIKMELERAARAGDPPTGRLQSDWRERMEDMLWALVNSPEFMFVP